jgi:hypothetical protein
MASTPVGAGSSKGVNTTLSTTDHGNDHAQAQEASHADGRKSPWSTARYPVQQASAALQWRRRLFCHCCGLRTTNGIGLPSFMLSGSAHVCVSNGMCDDRGSDARGCFDMVNPAMHGCRGKMLTPMSAFMQALSTLQQTHCKDNAVLSSTPSLMR